MSDYLQVTTTTESREAAEAIAQGLVRQRFAACVQILGPMASTYWWNGEVETAEEWMCVIKTRADRFHAVEIAIRDLHSYDVPEIVAVPIVEGSSDYLAWIRAETAPPVRHRLQS